MQATRNHLKGFDLTLICKIFGAVFIIVGALNLILIHPVPGLFYLLLSVLYFPFADTVFKHRFGIAIPPVVKIVVGLVILWGTLAVGDLAELLGL